jgi:hypothetical protein
VCFLNAQHFRLLVLSSLIALTGLTSLGYTKTSSTRLAPHIVKKSTEGITGKDSLEWEARKKQFRRAERTNDPEEGKSQLRKFLIESYPLAQRYSHVQNIWILRAQAALDADCPGEGAEAAQMLKRLGASRSQEPHMKELMTDLKSKGWTTNGFLPRFRQQQISTLSQSFTKACLESDWTQAEALIAQNGQPELIRALKDSTSGINGKSGEKALIKVADAGNLNVARILMAAGINANARNYAFPSDTALIYAVGSQHLNMVSALLAGGANVNATNSLGLTALMVAARDGYLDIVKALLANGAQVNAKVSLPEYALDTALTLAARSNQVDVVKALLVANAEIPGKDFNWSDLKKYHRESYEVLKNHTLSRSE